MESMLVKNLQPEFEPVAIVWSDTIPADAFQYKSGKFGCVLYLFAEACVRGKITGGSRESIVCTGGRAALGFGVGFDASDEALDLHAALFSKGIRSTKSVKAYQDQIDAAPSNWKSMFEQGERRHCNYELARNWILHVMPRYINPFKYVLFQPLSKTTFDENVRAVVFPVNQIELSALVTLAGSVMKGTDSVRVPQGADCFSISAFAYAEEESEEPRAVMGMLGADGREVMRKRFRDDILTLTLPPSLFLRMEQEADDSIFQIPSWKKFFGRGS